MGSQVFIPLHQVTQAKMKGLRSAGEQPRGINAEVKGHLNRVKETQRPAHRLSSSLVATTTAFAAVRFPACIL